MLTDYSSGAADGRLRPLLQSQRTMGKSYPLIVDGSKLRGSAMPRIVSGFRDEVIGKRIINAGYINIDGEMWPCLVLEGGKSIMAQCDDEGNGPGVLMGEKEMLCQTQPAEATAAADLPPWKNA